MELKEILITIAQLAFALAGFSGIIVAIKPKPIREWQHNEQVSFRILIQLSAIVVFFSIFPFGINILFKNLIFWKICSLAYAVYHFIDLIFFSIVLRAVKLPVHSKLIYVGIVVASIQLFTGLTDNASLMKFVYLATLVWHLSVCFIGFVMLIYGYGNDLNKSA